MNRDRCFNLKIGPILIGLANMSDQDIEEIGKYFGQPNIEGIPDYTVFLNQVFHDGPLDIPTSLFHDKKMSPSGFTIGEDLLVCKFKKRNAAEIFVKGPLVHSHLTRVFEQILYQVFYSAARERGFNGMLVHSSGVAKLDQGFLFVGASGKGKST